MIRQVYQWVDKRLNITPIWRDVADHEVPRHVNPAHHFSAFIYCFGGLTFFIVVLQILSGMFLALNVVPDILNASTSIKYLHSEVAMGSIVHGMHYWGASISIVMLFLHTLRVFFTGSYKHPREFNWVVGVLIFFIMLGLGFTGYLIPMDDRAYYASVVGVQIAEAVPGIGEYIAEFLQGGEEVGAQTLIRFYALHVFFLPGALLAMIAVHFVLIRRQGISGPL